MPQEQQHVPRQTFIALRARRQAFGIGTDLLYHDIESHPPLRVLGMPAKPDRRHVVERGLRIMSILILASMALCVLACVSFAIGFGWIQLPRLR